MKLLLLFVMLAAGCASTLSPAERLAGTLFVQVFNGNPEPVDVELACGAAPLTRISWLMPQNEQRKRLYIGRHFCDFRVSIRQAIEGGPYTRRPRFDEVLHSVQGCSLIRIEANPLLAASFVMLSTVRACQ